MSIEGIQIAAAVVGLAAATIILLLGREDRAAAWPIGVVLAVILVLLVTTEILRASEPPKAPATETGGPHSNVTPWAEWKRQ